jgi:hypothetical protein
LTFSDTMVISPRFCGPPKSGNGGYVCGRVAAAIPGAATVRLKAPPPLDAEMRLEGGDGVARLLHGESVIAEARAATLDVTPPQPPSFAEAEAAAKSYPGFTRHPFPRCFVCGPQRSEGDGMRIFPGPIASRSLVAAPWVPDASLLRPEFLWAALDCTSGFAVLPLPEGKAIVLGELCARIDGSLAAGDKCIVAGWPLGADGRKRLGAAAIFDSSGRAVAIGRATWIEVAASAFGGR